ncbi:MAG TPA: immunoglobulin domain-containing protein [Clostridia bacterium]|nr:immunoglobulin domain-containing protein [Clostridia bacterium]
MKGFPYSEDVTLHPLRNGDRCDPTLTTRPMPRSRFDNTRKPLEPKKPEFNLTVLLRTGLPHVLWVLSFAFLGLGEFPVRGQTLAESLNTSNLTWTTTGDSLWFAQTNVTHDRVAAAQTGAITNDGISVLQTTLIGPGTLTFWWQVPYQGQHGLMFTVDGMTNAQIYGSSWKQVTNYLGYGEHVVQWIFAKRYAGGKTDDSGQLDEVVFTPGTTAPFISSQPADLSQVPGLDATFTVSAIGTPPLGYQWQINGTNIPGAQTSTLTITNFQPTNAGQYSVVVSNVAGAVFSSNAVLSQVSVAAWAGKNDIPSSLTNVLAIAVSDDHNLALRADGRVVGWGYNAFGQADPPADLTNAIAISVGDFHSVALKRDGTVVAWGRNDFGQTEVPPGLSNVVAIAAGGNHSFALRSDGVIIDWGNSHYSSIPAGLSDVVSISAGGAHCMALEADGSVVVWGSNFAGLRDVPTDLTNVVSIAAGSSHCLALRADGTVKAWGDNYGGATNVPEGLSNVVAIAGGTFRSFALKAGDQLVAWGAQPDVPSVPVGLRNILAVASSLYHNLALIGNQPLETHAPLSSPKWHTDLFSVSVPTQSGRVYRLERKDSFQDFDWVPLPLVAGTGRDVTLTDTLATNTATRFYRVRCW